MGQLEFSITYNGDDRAKTPIEIDYKKAYDENFVITSYDKDGETWHRMSTRPGRGAQKRAAMAQAAEQEYSWMIEQNKTLEGCNIIRKKMIFDSQIMPLSSSLFDKLNAKEKQLTKKEKASVKKKLEEKQKQAGKSERKTTKQKREVR